MKKIFLLASCVFATCPVAADKLAATDTLRSVSLSEAEVVATRATSKTPLTFFNLDKKSIERQNIGRDIPFLLEHTPSVVSSSDAGMGIGYTALRVRGIDASRINVSVNGIPINDAESNSVFWVNMGDFASSVSSLQIQRGIGTSTGGSGAFGANVNMLSDPSPLSPYLKFGASAGSYGAHKETLQFATGLLKNHFSFSGRLSNLGSDGYINRASTKLNSYFFQGAYISDNTLVRFITFNGTERTYHAWDYATKAQMRKYGRRYNPSGEYFDSEGKRCYYNDQTDDYHQQHYQLLLTQDLHKGWSLNAALHYTRGKGFYEQYKSGQKLYKYQLESSLGSKSDLVRRKYSSADFYGGVASLNYTSGKLDFSLGGGWNQYDGDHYGRVLWVQSFQGKNTPDHPYYDNDARKRDGNIFAKVNYEFLPKLHGFADLQYRGISYRMDGPSDQYDENKKRIDYDVDKKYHFFNPKMGLLYELPLGQQVYASYALAHKEPTRNDFEDNLIQQPRAELLNDWEVGYRLKRKNIQAGASLYYMDYQDQFVLTGEQDAIGEMIARNVGSSYRMGIELEASWQVCQALRWNANLSFSRNQAKNWKVTLDDTGKSLNVGDTPLAFSPKVVFNNQFLFQYKGLEASLFSHLVGSQFMTNSGFRSYREANGKEVSLMLSRYFVNDLDVSYTFRLPFVERASVGITIYNLLNAKYESYGAAATQFRSKAGGCGAEAYQDDWGSSYSVYSAQAPIHFMAHFSVSL